MIELDMSNVRWFSADMAAPVSVLFDHWRAAANTIKLAERPHPKVADTLRRNGLLCELGLDPLPDGYRTSVPLRRFSGCIDLQGLAFLRDEVFCRPDLPRMTPNFRRALMSRFGEVFTNVSDHASTTIVAACGQVFPRDGVLHLTISDGGVGIPAHVREHLGRDVTDTYALDWAMKRGNTTRREMLGGDGLWLLSQFIRENGGSLTVVSGHGYWRVASDAPELRLLAHPFPGTSLHWQITLEDDKTYRLESE